MAISKGYAFTNHLQNAYGRNTGNSMVNYQRFKEEYFAGADVRIYFGKTWVDEIVSLNFTLQENAAPIFGYASYVYDRMAVGSRQIQGSFRVNFKESYYLHSITNQLDYELSAVTDPTSVRNGSEVTLASYNKITPDHLVSSVNNGEFEKLATQFEDSLWGISTNDAMNARTLNRRQSSFFEQEDGRPSLAKYGFNIVILYGPYTQNYDPEAPTESVASTAHTLTGVYLTGVNQVIDNSGSPIYEEYSFIARDLDANVNTYTADPTYNFGSKVNKE